VCLAATALAFVSSAPAANAAHVSCGETITADTTLDSDLTKCAPPGIRIGADDITLDLNGHSITGKGKGVGVNNIGGHDGVTIEGGTVRNFMESVVLMGATNNHLRGLSVSENHHVGIYVQDSDAIWIEQSSVADVRFSGIFLNRSRDIRVAGNSVSASRGGVIAQASDHIAIEGNAIEGNDGFGIGLVQGTSETDVGGNTVSSNEFGIVLDDADANRVSENVAFENGDNISVLGSRNTITDNQVADAAGCKKNCGGYGISLEGGAGNLIAQNVVRGSSRDGIRIDAFVPEIPTLDNIVRDNLISDATVDGLSIGTDGAGTVTNTLIERNTATGSGDDGLDIRRPAATLTGNAANDNFDFGIETVSGVVDGGGNTAGGNGNPLQCTNVFCL
jgi:parallel beta-helix repeat protein